MAFRIPQKRDSLIHVGQGLTLEKPDLIKMLVWNVYKGHHGPKWQKDFLHLSQGKDLILLQEALHSGWMSEIWTQHFPAHHWKMATSFAYKEIKTGVATGSRFQASFVDFIRGSERELFIGTPKVSLASRYKIGPRPSDEHDVLVINTHVVNFTTTGAFVRFIEELLSLVESHSGPLVIAGDFNTWNFRRWFHLLKILAQFEVKPIEFDFDPRVLKLDHVFVRGFRVAHAHIHHHVQSSDHFPLEVWLEWDAPE